MPANLLTGMSTQGVALGDQRALQIALELSKLGLNDNESSPPPPTTPGPGPASSQSTFDNETAAVAAAVKKSANMTECVPVPSSEHVAEIVGRQGCKIKALRAKTNTYIKTPVRGAEPVFVVTGRKEDVAAAKREILSAAEHFSQIRASRRNNNGAIPGSIAPGPPSPNTPGQVTIQVRVPYRVVGLVVGPKGATIKRIQQQTHTYIVTPSRDKEPIFEVTGLPENVEKARQEIESHIAARTGGILENGLNGIGGLPLPSDEHSPIDFQSRALDTGLRDINDFLGAMYKSNSNSAFTSYTSALNKSNNIATQRSPDNKIFAFPALNGSTGRLNDLTSLCNGFSAPSGFGLYEQEDGRVSPSIDISPLPLPTANIWSDVGGVPNGISLFAPVSTASCAPRRNSMTIQCTSNSTDLSPTFTDGSGSGGDQHSSVRRIRSDPISTSLMNVSQFDALSGFAPSSASISSGSTSSSPTDSMGSGGQRRSCLICSEGGVVAALVPCGHNHFCMDCANLIMSKGDTDRRCPVCQQTPTQAIRIFSN